MKLRLGKIKKDTFGLRKLLAIPHVMCPFRGEEREGKRHDIGMSYGVNLHFRVRRGRGVKNDQKESISHMDSP